jgi:hypothetical protein
LGINLVNWTRLPAGAIRQRLVESSTIGAFTKWKTIPGGKMPYSISMKDYSPFVFARLWEGWKDPLNCGWLDVIQRDKHLLNSQEHSAEPNWNIALFSMKR